MDTPKSDYLERTGTEWLVLELGAVRVRVNTNHNPKVTLKLTARFQSFLGNLILEYPV